MEIETLAKEVLNSNLSDDAKIWVMKAIFTEKMEWIPPYNTERMPVYIPNPIIWKDNPWKITCSE